MVEPLMPERAPNHSAVSRNFFNNPLLRSDEAGGSSSPVHGIGRRRCRRRTEASSDEGGGLRVAAETHLGTNGGPDYFSRTSDGPTATGPRILVDKEGNIITVERPGMVFCWVESLLS